MINNNLLTALPIYDSRDKQFHRSVNYDVCTFELLCSQYRLLPWQFRRPPSVATITSIKLTCYNEENEYEILADIPSGDLSYATTSGWDYISYHGAQDLLDTLPCGNYYLVITDGTDTWYSEVFKVTDAIDDSDNYRITRDGVYREHDDDELRVYI